VTKDGRYRQAPSGCDLLCYYGRWRNRRSGSRYLKDELVVDAWGGFADETTERMVEAETLFRVFSVTSPQDNPLQRIEDAIRRGLS
jgi:hypothetical protein